MGITKSQFIGAHFGVWVTVRVWDLMGPDSLLVKVSEIGVEMTI